MNSIVLTTTPSMPAPQTLAVDSATPKPAVKTFDIFDTLIARRCIEPARVFEMVGQRGDMPDFAAARRQAERNIAGGPYDLDAIYDELGRMLQLDPLKLAALKAIEIEIEREQVVPIAENIARVAEGDVLISDMYLGAPIIRELLSAAGFSKKVGLVVSSDGKRSGRIWPHVTAGVAIEEHLGDNIRSDVESPAAFGIRSRHTTVFAPNPIEETLLRIGLRELAELCREVRLSTWSPDPRLRTLQVIQASLNFPMLLLASVPLARLASRLGKRSVLFSSRDCDLWLPLFRNMAKRVGADCDATYFYTSRVTKTNPSADYRAYVTEKLHDRSLVVDVCGTGWSLAHLAAQMGVSNLDVFFFHKLPTADSYEAKAPTPETCRFHAVIGPSDLPLYNTMLEMCNYAEHGMVSDVRIIEGAAVPIFAADARPIETIAAVREQQATFRRAVETMSKYGLGEILALDDQAIGQICAALYQALSQQTDLRAIFGESHTAEEVAVRRIIGCA